MITKDWESEPTNTDALDALRVNRSDKKIDYAKVQSLLLSCEHDVLEKLQYGNYTGLFDDNDKRQQWCFQAGVVIVIEAALKRLEEM